MFTIVQWIDLLWLPLAWFIVKKHQRLIMMCFLVSCMTMLRMQAELMDSIGYSNGFITGAHINAFQRGIITYTFFYFGIMLIFAYSPFQEQTSLASWAIATFFAAFFVSSIVMIT